MSPAVRDRLRFELLSRGFSGGGAPPNDTIVLDDAYLHEVSVSDLLGLMVVRREKGEGGRGGRGLQGWQSLRWQRDRDERSLVAAPFRCRL